MVGCVGVVSKRVTSVLTVCIIGMMLCLFARVLSPGCGQRSMVSSIRQAASNHKHHLLKRSIIDYGYISPLPPLFSSKSFPTVTYSLPYITPRIHCHPNIPLRHCSMAAIAMTHTRAQPPHLLLCCVCMCVSTTGRSEEREL